MSQLTLRYRFDDTDDFGWLDVAVETENFSGRGGFWVQWQDVKEFGEGLSIYPIDPDAPLTATWGYEMQEGEDLILSITIAPASATGDLNVSVEMADLHEQSQRLRTSFFSNYPDLDRFRTEIAALMNQESDKAVLTGR